MRAQPGTERVLADVWRVHAPHVLAAVARRSGDFGAAEDAVQEALLAASEQWPGQGVPEDSVAWLVTVAFRRLVDAHRSDVARTRRELLVSRLEPGERAGFEDAGDVDDSMALLLLCCHPALPPPGQVALTLRAVGGLTTAQVARAFLVPEATMAQRISRAKARLRAVGAREARLDHRLGAVRAHLLEMAGDAEAARAAYLAAAAATTSIAEQRYLTARARTTSASRPAPG